MRPGTDKRVDTTASDRIADIPRARPDALERALIDRWQRGFPLSSRPYAEIAATLNVSEDEILAALARLHARGVLSRVGATVQPGTAGASTLAAMAVPPARLEAIAALVSAYDEVNHNYEREHRLNLWFVVTAPTAARLARVLEDIARRSGIEVVDLPLEEAYHLDLGFAVQWN